MNTSSGRLIEEGHNEVALGSARPPTTLVNLGEKCTGQQGVGIV
jgi:hypothetical protein